VTSDDVSLPQNEQQQQEDEVEDGGTNKDIINALGSRCHPEQ
jgi:hypothetical protein